MLNIHDELTVTQILNLHPTLLSVHNCFLKIERALDLNEPQQLCFNRDGEND